MEQVTEQAVEQAAAKHPGGRPSSYSNEVVTTICLRIAEGESLRSICQDEGMPHRATVHVWLDDPARTEFHDRYARARVAQAWSLAEEALHIADTCDDPAKARLQVDTRRWFAGKVAPRVFSDQAVRLMNAAGDGDPVLTLSASLADELTGLLTASYVDVTPRPVPEALPAPGDEPGGATR